MDEYKHKELTDVIIKVFYMVYNNLGYGFLEKVYAQAMAIELRKLGYDVIHEHQINVFYDGERIGEYYADLVINGLVIVELKAVKALQPEHAAQLLNYLKATSIEVGLLLNFGPKPQISRKVYDNDRKGSMKWMKK